jgi:hypothetical protein
MSLLKVDQVQTVSGVNYNFGKIVRYQHYSTGYGSGSRTTTTSGTYSGLNISGTGYTGPRLSTNANIISFPKSRTGTDLLIEIAFPVYLATSVNSGAGIRCQIGLNTVTYNILDITPEGPGHGWGAFGYGGNAADILTFTWSTKDNTALASAVRNFTGDVYFWWQGRSWAGDTVFYIDYDATYPKYGSINVYEVLED